MAMVILDFWCGDRFIKSLPLNAIPVKGNKVTLVGWDYMVMDVIPIEKQEALDADYKVLLESQKQQ